MNSHLLDPPTGLQEKFRGGRPRREREASAHRRQLDELVTDIDSKERYRQAGQLEQYYEEKRKQYQ